ncbi:protein ecdysoneless [Athalia rosae]|uniref:protein ecdysoneless n=1 Tax=Athalia rosae TaxID=37344 RepID=UPI0020332960|nr:protein ecdysoneless [Athalia rosae]
MLPSTQRISDDFVECFFFPRFCYQSKEDVSEELLTSEVVRFNNVIEEYTKHYMWHRDSLVFYPRTKHIMFLQKQLESSIELEGQDLPPHIYVGLRYDEDVGDEWFLVFLVMELTKAFKGLIVKLVDSDGEFLLIEAADVLPNWASPQTCQDRVFIFNGEVHVVQGKDKTYLQMLQQIQDKPEISRMDDPVQAAISKKISIYPDEISKKMHKARVFLPERAIAILNQEPGLIAAAVRSVCHSDPLERKVCQAMRYFPPEQRAMVNIKMTKCLYAMACHCRYAGDPRTGWNLPLPDDPRHGPHLLGIKISCGLEMLIARSNRKHKEAKGADTATLSDNEFGNGWAAYLKRLNSHGYFRNLLSGSQEYNQLLQTAKEYFHANSIGSSLVDDQHEIHRVQSAWRNAQHCDIESLNSGRLSPADGDDWLNIDPEQLQSMLNQQWPLNDQVHKQHQPTLEEKVKEFLSKSSDVDGVQFLGHQSKSHGDNNESKMNTDVDDSRIDFSADAFDSALRGILDLVVPDENDFDSSSEGSLGGSEEDKGGELDKYMRILDSQLELDLHLNSLRCNVNGDSGAVGSEIEANLRESAEGESGGAGPVGNILGGPVRRLMHLQLQSPSTVPPDLQS